jgi:flagellar secretion chaperone FliS
MFAPYKSHAHAYSNVHVETSVANADPHQLVLLLLDGALSAIAAACRAIEQRDIPAKCRAVSRASGIIDEGLRGALDLKQGGAVAATLHDLYSCVLLRLTQAHAANDIAMLRECSDLLNPLRAAWTSIRPQLKAA